MLCYAIKRRPYALLCYQKGTPLLCYAVAEPLLCHATP